MNGSRFVAIFCSHFERQFLSCEWVLTENLGMSLLRLSELGCNSLADGDSLVNKAAQADCLSADLVAAQDMVQRQQTAYHLLITTSPLDDNNSMTRVGFTNLELASAHNWWCLSDTHHRPSTSAGSDNG